MPKVWHTSLYIRVIFLKFYFSLLSTPFNIFISLGEETDSKVFNYCCRSCVGRSKQSSLLPFAHFILTEELDITATVSQFGILLYWQYVVAIISLDSPGIQELLLFSVSP